jgi:chorismate mutase
MGRYTCPEEHAFFPNRLPAPVAPRKVYESPLHPNNININEQILAFYRTRIVPQIAENRDEPSSYGSASTCDIAVLQCLSRRIHYGKMVAESKFLSEPQKFTALIENQDARAILDALTYPKVEEKLLERVRDKADTYGKDQWGVAPGADEKPAWRIDPQTVVEGKQSTKI